MDMLQVFHMNGGEGEASYAKNCTVQSTILSITRTFVEAAMHDYLSNNENLRGDTITIADLGCSSGPTALEAVTRIMDVVEARRRVTKFMVYLVDLPGNDYNGLFKFVASLQKKLRKEKGVDFGPCFIAGLAGNFYGRLLPNQTLDFAHSSSSLHWLSKVPMGLDANENPRMLNKGKIYLSMTSPSDVINAYRLQFRNDFLSFLVCRSEEVVSGGRMVLTFMGRNSYEPATSPEDSYPWDLIAEALMTLVSEGLIEEEKVDSLNVPYYAPCLEEVKQLIEEESSFKGHHYEAIEIEWDGGSKIEEPQGKQPAVGTRGAAIAKMHRAVVEPMLKHYFGGDVMDELFSRYRKVLDDHLLSNDNPKLTNIVISLIRK